MRAPLDSSYTSNTPKRPKSAVGFGSSPGGGKKSLKQSRNAKEAAKKQESESRKVKRAEENKKAVFSEIKRIVDSKSDEEPFLPPFITM